MVGKSWTKDEKKLICKLRSEGLTPKQIYDNIEYLPGRTLPAIRQRCVELKMTDKPNKWNPKELWTIWILNKKSFNISEIADYLSNRTKNAVANQLSRHGLYFHPPDCKVPNELKMEVKEILGCESK
jgi:hypothetical protein